MGKENFGDGWEMDLLSPEDRDEIKCLVAMRVVDPKKAARGLAPLVMKGARITRRKARPSTGELTALVNVLQMGLTTVVDELRRVRGELDALKAVR